MGGVFQRFKLDILGGLNRLKVIIETELHLKKTTSTQFLLKQSYIAKPGENKAPQDLPKNSQFFNCMERHLLGVG